MSGRQNTGSGACSSHFLTSDGRDENKSHFEDGTLILACDAKNPAEPVQWLKNAKQENNKGLNIEEDVTFDGTDKFSCDTGAVKIECSVTVKKLPIEHRVPLKTLKSKTKDEIILHCECEISQEPASWFINDKKIDKPRDKRLKLSAEKFIQVEVKDITKGDAGEYRCIYKGIETTLKLEVGDSQDKNKSKSAKQPSFNCEIRSKDSPLVTWYKDEQKINIDNRKFISKDNMGERSLSITNANTDDAGKYSCICWDGSSESTIFVAKPDPPFDLNYENDPYGSVTLNWKAGLERGLSQQFRVGYEQIKGGHKCNYVDVKPSDSTECTVTELAPGTEYKFFVTAHNDVGQSSRSNAVTVRTPDKPDQPTDLQVVEFSENNVSLNWKAGSNGGLLQTFTVSYKPTTDTPKSRYTEVKSQDQTKLTVDGLAPGTEYEFFVTAHNELGESLRSKTVTERTLAKPDQPTDLQVVEFSENNVSLKWKAGRDGGLPQTFTVSYKPTTSPQKSRYIDVQPPGLTEFTIDGLLPRTEYEFVVTAYNNCGKSSPSKTVTAKTSGSLTNWTKSPLFIVGCSVLLSLVLNYVIHGDTHQLPPQTKELSSLEQRLDDTSEAILIMKRKHQDDQNSFLEMIEKYKNEINHTDENKFKDIIKIIDDTARNLSSKADEQELEDAKTIFENKVKETEVNLKKLMEQFRNSVNERLEKLTKFIDEFNEKFAENQVYLKALEQETSEKTVKIKETLDSVRSKVEEDVPVMIEEVKQQLDLIKKAKNEADQIVEVIQNDVGRIMPNTFNKEALIMAFMVMIVFLFMLALWIYKVQNSLTAGAPIESRDMNAKDVLQRIPHRVKLSNSICMVSFDEARKDAHEALVKSAFLTTGNIETVYFVVRRHEHLLKLPRCKFYIMCTEFSERHVIIEEPGLGLGDLKRCTYETIQRFGAKMLILYTRDPGSRNLGEQLYNHKIHCVFAQPELSSLRDHGRFFSTYDELSDTQKRSLNDTIVKCIH